MSKCVLYFRDRLFCGSDEPSKVELNAKILLPTFFAHFLCQGVSHDYHDYYVIALYFYGIFFHPNTSLQMFEVSIRLLAMYKFV